MASSNRSKKCMRIARQTRRDMMKISMNENGTYNSDNSELSDIEMSSGSTNDSDGCNEPSTFEYYCTNDNASDPESHDLINSKVASNENPEEVDPYADPNSLSNKLRTWAIRAHVSHSQINMLLPILKEYHPDLPLSSKTLLKVVKNYNIVDMLSAKDDAGEYVYFGITQNLKYEFRRGLHHILQKYDKTQIDLICNIDGAKIHVSTLLNFWPILGMIYIKGIKFSPFPIAIYNGKGKPKHVTEYLKDFVDEINHMHTYGFSYGGKKYEIRLKAIICDAPARAFIKCIKGHGGFFGCEKCTQRGFRINNKVIFPEIDNVILRNDNSFIRECRSRVTEHVTGLSPLLDVSYFGLVSGFPLDYMHMACLGVMKRVLGHWLQGAAEHRLAPSKRQIASRRILDVAEHTPCEFDRKPRSLTEVDYWKAKEFRTFMNYYGPYIMEDLISNKQFKHFLLLHISMRILCSGNYRDGLGEIAKEKMKQFSARVQYIYGEDAIIYNMHSIFHMAKEAVDGHYSLDEMSCFPFESYLGKLVKMIRTPNKPLAQVCVRLAEQSNFLEEYPLNRCNTVNENKTILNHHHGYKINITSDKDSFILLKNKRVMKVVELIETNNILTIKGRIFGRQYEAYTEPVSSKVINVYKVQELNNFLFEEPVGNIECKCFVIPMDNHFLVMGMLHNELCSVRGTEETCLTSTPRKSKQVITPKHKHEETQHTPSLELRKENFRMLTILEKHFGAMSVTAEAVSKFTLPVQTDEDLVTLDDSLNSEQIRAEMILQMSLVGGDHLRQMVSNILKFFRKKWH
ncbi:uncharacterized protein LOC116170009 [Photinus pyralis]|uniref:uncharacterized protein LOC116170009 n=1 Tax=Photinus pyralis TaxID=7054 RepID=UPI0012674C53|nr:uncharacterized protein LOC116170009 [Photinus pyralis]